MYFYFDSLQNRTSSGEELYIYADTESQSWHIPRNEVTFEKLLKKGHFANIYKATLKGNRTNVVAKTLKGKINYFKIMK